MPRLRAASPEGGLDSVDYRILEACLRNPEASQAQIANAIGLSQRAINRRVNKEAFRRELTARYEKCVKDAVLIARAYAPKVTRRLVNIVNDKRSDDRDVINAAREINRLAIESKITLSFDERGLNVNHKFDLSKLSDDDLEIFEKLLIKMGAIAVAAEAS